MERRRTTITPKTIAGAVAVGVLFVAASFLGQRWAMTMHGSFSGGAAGMLIYVGMTALAVVVAPVSGLPLLPLAARTWGPVIAALLSIIGWTIGAQVAFGIARRFGHAFVERVAALGSIHRFATRLPNRAAFWPLVLLRMTIPVDVLSYAIGLLTHIPATTYFLATLIGVAPFAFIFSYAGTFPWYVQVVALLGGAALWWLRSARSVPDHGVSRIIPSAHEGRQSHRHHEEEEADREE